MAVGPSTTIPSWWERLVFAPNYVNYHLEHHFQANVPCYHLPAFHRFLEAKGVYEETKFPNGYGELFAKTVPA